jgi:DNA-binding transcriptional LysR family regulator
MLTWRRIRPPAAGNQSERLFQPKGRIDEYSASPCESSIMATRPDFLGLEAFVAVAERGSFRLAAAHLGITQTALSHRMRKLESYLGVSLLHRTTRRVSITPSGLSLLPRAKALIEDAQRTFADLSVEAAVRQERVAIGCLPTLAIHFLPQVLTQFAVDNPDIQVRIFDNSASEIAERVQKGDAEFGLTILATNRWDLDIKPLVREPYVLVCHAEHQLAKRRSVSWRQLAGENLIRISTQTGNRILIDDALGALGETLRWRSEVQHVTTAVALVSAGIGMTVVPRGTIDAVRPGNLACVPLRNPGITRTLGVVTRHGVPLSPVARRLLALIERQIALVMRRKLAD